MPPDSPTPDPWRRVFFIGQAIVELAAEQLERSLTETLSQLGRFDAEQREALRRLSQEVIDRAERAERAKTEACGGSPSGSTESSAASATGPDLQAELDDLRAEIARLRAEIKRLAAG